MINFKEKYNLHFAIVECKLAGSLIKIKVLAMQWPLENVVTNTLEPHTTLTIKLHEMG